MTNPADDLRSRFRREKTHALALLLAAAEVERRERWQIARAEAQALLERAGETSAHTDWMDECVPLLMSYGKDQVVAIAACLNMWRDTWELEHPDGAVDPGPSPKEAADKTLRALRQRLRDELGS